MRDLLEVSRGYNGCWSGYQAISNSVSMPWLPNYLIFTRILLNYSQGCQNKSNLLGPSPLFYPSPRFASGLEKGLFEVIQEWLQLDPTSIRPNLTWFITLTTNWVASHCLPWFSESFSCFGRIDTQPEMKSSKHTRGTLLENFIISLQMSVSFSESQHQITCRKVSGPGCVKLGGNSSSNSLANMSQLNIRGKKFHCIKCDQTSSDKHS